MSLRGFPEPEQASCNIRSIYGEARLHVFSFGPHEEDKLLCVDARPSYAEARAQVPLVRVQSACYTSEIFRSTDCDCHEQLHTSLELVHRDEGLLLYMLCDGRGAGLLTKIRGLALGDTEHLDTYDAYKALGVEVDPREYTTVATALRYLGVDRLRLLTNNPKKIQGLTSSGLVVDRVPLVIPATADSASYLRTKQVKFGHMLDYPTTDEERES